MLLNVCPSLFLITKTAKRRERERERRWEVGRERDFCRKYLYWTQVSHYIMKINNHIERYFHTFLLLSTSLSFVLYTREFWFHMRWLTSEIWYNQIIKNYSVLPNLLYTFIFHICYIKIIILKINGIKIKYSKLSYHIIFSLITLYSDYNAFSVKERITATVENKIKNTSCHC